MYLHFLLSAGAAIELSGTGFLVAVAVFACLLGVEFAGILILAGKMSRARREKQELQNHGRDSSEHYHYAVPVVALGAIPQATYLAFSILAGLVAVSAVVLTVLLVVARKKGYLFISAKDAASLAEAEKMPHKTVEEPIVSQLEEQPQKAYAEAEETGEAAFAVFEDTYEPFYEQMPVSEEFDEDRAEEIAAEEAPAAPAAPVALEDSASAESNQPYKIVEKIVTETQKEVVREVPVQSPAQTAAAEQLMEKLTDFLDYELQKRKDADLAENTEETLVAAFSQKELLPQDEESSEEDDDEDEDELDEADGASGDEEDDIDNEEPDSEDRFTGNERIIGFDENTGCYIVAHYRKSFEAKLIQARPRIKQYYSELKNALLSYKGTKSRISWTADSFHNGRTQIAKINVKTNILELYLALEPESLDGTVYRGRNVGNKKKYAETPFQYKLRTPRKFKWAMELVQRTCEEQGLSPIDIEKIDYEQQYPFDTTESLVERKLIKEYIREEKPATTFELAPDHTPELPAEDDSVIPANANFLWELDNDAPAHEEEAPVAEEIPKAEPEEPISEDPISEEPAVAEASAPAEQPASSVVKETVKITEMRYTERYYTDAEPTYEQVITTRESVIPVEGEDITEDAVYEDVAAAEEEPSDVLSTEEELTNEIYDAYEPAAVIIEEETVEAIGEDELLEDEFFFGETQPTEEEIYEEEIVYEEPTEEEIYEEEIVYEEPAEEEIYEEEIVYEEPAEEEIYEEEIVYEEPAEEEIYEEEIVYEEPAEEEIYEEEIVYEEPAEEEIYEEEVYEDPVEEVYEEEVYEEEVYEEEVYEEEVYEEEVYEEVEEDEPVVAERISRDAVPTKQIPMDTGVAVIDICSVASAFAEGETVSLETLKAKGLVVPTAKTLKIYAGGSLDKRLSVEAHHFSLEAIFAIGTAGGETSMLY